MPLILENDASKQRILDILNKYEAIKVYGILAA